MNINMKHGNTDYFNNDGFRRPDPPGVHSAGVSVGSGGGWS